MSFYTVGGVPSTLNHVQQRRLQQVIQASVGSGGSGRDSGRSVSTWVASKATEDAGSFFTAKGSLNTLPASRMVRDCSPVESDEEVEDVLALHEQDIVGGLGESTADETWEYGETPLPSRVLYLRHTPRMTSVPALSGPLSFDFIPDPWTLISRARESMEKAFWGLVMPSFRGAVALSESLNNGLPKLSALVPAVSSPSTTDGVDQGSSDPERFTGNRNNGLYAQETVYALRLPPTVPSDQDCANDLGPTLRPVYVKTRAAMPTWDEKGDDWRRAGGIRMML